MQLFTNVGLLLSILLRKVSNYVISLIATYKYYTIAFKSDLMLHLFITVNNNAV